MYRHFAEADTQILQKLDDLLTCADVGTIRSCVHDRSPCAVSRLATLVCDALPLWAYTSHILQLLCRCNTTYVAFTRITDNTKGYSFEFTDKLFVQSPGLLNALLVKANSSQRDFDDVRLLIIFPGCIDS